MHIGWMIICEIKGAKKFEISNAFFSNHYSVEKEEAKEFHELLTQTKTHKLQIHKLSKQVNSLKKQMARVEKLH